jgi:hypothetical protein
VKLARIAPTIAFVFGTPPQFRALLERYASAPAALREAIRDMDHGTLTTRVGDAPWTVRDVLVHLSDVSIDDAARIRRAIMEAPNVPGTFDAEVGRKRLQPVWRTIEVVLAEVEIVHFATAELLAHCDAAGWSRSSPPDGPSVEQLVDESASRFAGNVAAIAAARAARSAR